MKFRSTPSVVTDPTEGIRFFPLPQSRPKGITLVREFMIGEPRAVRRATWRSTEYARIFGVRWRDLGLVPSRVAA